MFKMKEKHHMCVLSGAIPGGGRLSSGKDADKNPRDKQPGSAGGRPVKLGLMLWLSEILSVLSHHSGSVSQLFNGAND